MNISSFAKWELSHSNNKYIIQRIKNFQKYNGVFEVKANKYKFDISSLKGINISKWEKLISDLKKSINIEEVNDVISHYKNNYYNYPGFRNPDYRIPRPNKISILLERTLKKVLVNKIMKEVNKCA
jgi:two-component SAPR family response regulator